MKVFQHISTVELETARLQHIHANNRRQIKCLKIRQTVRSQSGPVRFMKIRPNIVRGGLISENPSGQV